MRRGSVCGHATNIHSCEFENTCKIRAFQTCHEFGEEGIFETRMRSRAWKAVSGQFSAVFLHNMQKIGACESVVPPEKCCLKYSKTAEDGNWSHICGVCTHTANLAHDKSCFAGIPLNSFILNLTLRVCHEDRAYSTLFSRHHTNLAHTESQNLFHSAFAQGEAFTMAYRRLDC